MAADIAPTGVWSEQRTEIPMLRILALLFAFSLAATTPIAAAAPLDGTWSGMLDFGNGAPLLFVVTISSGSGGKLSATGASPYQGGGVIPVDAISSDNGALTFSIKKLGVSYTGTIGSDAIAGNFTQLGKTVPLVLTPSSLGTSTLVGTWLGTLAVPGGSLLLALHVRNDGSNMSATFDSPYQRGFGIPVSSVGSSDGTFTFALKNINASYIGKIEPSAIEGTFTQNGQSFPLKLARP